MIYKKVQIRRKVKYVDVKSPKLINESNGSN